MCTTFADKRWHFETIDWGKETVSEGNSSSIRIPSSFFHYLGDFYLLADWVFSGAFFFQLELRHDA